MGMNESYVGAPYNFIELSKKVYGDKQCVPHNVNDKERKSGVIRYSIIAETPIFIGGADKGKFYENCYGQVAIPGSTIRGLVRNNVQILSASSVGNDIQNSHLMYRAVATPQFRRKVYNDILGKDQKVSILREVSAGYIYNAYGKYCIYRAKTMKADNMGKDFGKMNYFVLSERKIIESGYKDFEYLRNFQLQHKNEHFVKKWNRKDRKQHYIGKQNKQYRPYVASISYQLGKDGRTVVSVAAPGEYELNGYLLSSGAMKEKKVIYLIPEIDRSSQIDIQEQDIQNFRRDFEGRKKQLGKDKAEFYDLPLPGQIKPVFYIEKQDKLYFGFTPRLRLFYEHDIFSGLPEEHKKETLDYNKTLFGYASDVESYKSRLSFLDAVMDESNFKTLPKREVVLSSPKPTSFFDYLKPVQGDKHTFVSYDDRFELRGVKQYWLHDCITGSVEEKKQSVRTMLTPYKRGVKFTGEIHFYHLSDEELGMVLWGLLLEKDSRQNIGQGKPYGYGRIQVKLLELQIEDRDKLYGTEALCLSPYQNMRDKADRWIQAAKDDMSAFYGKDIMSIPRIKDFFAMKDGKHIPDTEKIAYMSLDDYQNRNRTEVPLPSIQKVIENVDVDIHNNN